jgi:cytoskeletal protein RodZ
MDGEKRVRQIPVNSHPNAVQSEQPELEPEQEPPTPRRYEPLPPQYQKSQSKKGRYVLIALAILLLAGALAYWFLLKPKPAKTPSTSPASTLSVKNSGSKESALDTDHHESPSFNLGFDYPKSWKVSDISGSDKIVVTSPSMKLKNTDGQQVDGQIVITIRGKTQKLSEFDKGAATAVSSSEKITYTKPSEIQRGDTYISFVSFANSKDTGLDAIYITGDAGYQKNQTVPAVDISKIDPITNVTFVKCNDSKCTGTGTALTVNPDSWKDSNFSKPIKTVLQSLAIQ